MRGVRSSLEQLEVGDIIGFADESEDLRYGLVVEKSRLSDDGTRRGVTVFYEDDESCPRFQTDVSSFWMIAPGLTLAVRNALTKVWREVNPVDKETYESEEP